MSATRRQRRNAGRNAGRTDSLSQRKSAAPGFGGLGPLLQAGLDHHTAGRLSEAESCYRQLLLQDSTHADALHLLGAAAYQGGRSAEAVPLITRAVALNPGEPVYRNTLGAALKSLGLTIEAVTAYRQSLALAPDNAETELNLGLALKAGGDLISAIRHYRRSLALLPDNADALNSLAIALQDLGDGAGAIVEYGKALALRPGCPDYLNNMGTALLAENRTSEAIDHHSQALAVTPNFPKALLNLAIALQAAERPVEAVPPLVRALELQPDYPEAFFILGTALQSLSKLDEAIACYEEALALRPSYAEAHARIGAILHTQGRSGPAVAHLTLALTLKPDHAEAFHHLGVALQMLWRFSDATTCYGRALRLQRDYAAVHYELAAIRSPQPGEPAHAALMATLAESARLPADKAALVHYAYAKALDSGGDHPAALEHYMKGAALKRSRIAYSDQHVKRLFRRTRESFDAGLLERFCGAGAPGAPIFVVGMPRSGSTLVEQILASHPLVHGAGELKALDAAVREIVTPNDEPYQHFAAALSAETLTGLGNAYLSSLPVVAQGQRVTDKMPLNFLYLGLIRLILPNARIVHTMRDPVDTCVSCFTTLFSEGNEYSYDLGELGQFYNHYHELMAHWRSILPAGIMLDVRYEDVVDDIEGQARRLIAHCGLPWDPRCLDFHTNQRPIRTASYAQVRQPIYRSSVGRWHRYGDGLAPLLRELGITASAAAP